MNDDDIGRSDFTLILLGAKAIAEDYGQARGLEHFKGELKKHGVEWQSVAAANKRVVLRFLYDAERRGSEAAR